MNSFESITKEMDGVKDRVEKWLKDYLPDADKRLKKYIDDKGFDIEKLLVPLAIVKSKEKYGYLLKPESLYHIIRLAEQNPVLKELVKDSPFMLMKIGFIYEHAPVFILGGKANPSDIDNCVLEFAKNYTKKYLLNQIDWDLSPLVEPRQVYMTTFWDREHWDPIEYIKLAHENNIKGIEYAVGFHPFNLNKLLPEEIGVEKRKQIREIAKKLNVKLTIHTAIVGPYSTPDFNGTQLFYDPADIVDLHKETIILAKDIGAHSVTLHLIAPERIDRVIDIIKFARGYGVYVTLENYYYTNKIKQNSENFIEILDLIVSKLPDKIKLENFGITFDPGHYNIEGEDPVISAVNIGKWCSKNSIGLIKIHATTNYGPLNCFPPNYSSDVHDPVSYPGINNQAVIKIIRALGHMPEVVAEQISPLSEQDIYTIDDAIREPILDNYEQIVSLGKDKNSVVDNIIDEQDIEAYNFIAGIDGIKELRKHLIYRRIQGIDNMTSETAQEVTSILMRASTKEQHQILEQLKALLDSVIDSVGEVSPDSINDVCDRLSGALNANLTKERLNELFSDIRIYQKGDIICEQNTLGNELYYLKDGEAEVLLNNEKVNIFSSGDIFGEMAVFRSKPRSATIRATERSEIGVLNLEHITTAIKSKDDHARAVLYNLYRVLPQRLRDLNDRYVRLIESAKAITDLELSKSLQPMSISDVQPILGLEIFNYDELDKLFYREKVYKKDEVVFEENSKDNTIYFVKNGVFDVVKQKNEDLITIARLTKGSILGEMAIMMENSQRTATIISRSNSRLGYLSREELERIVIKNDESDFSYKLLLTLCSTISYRIAKLNQNYMDVKSQMEKQKEKLYHQNLWVLK